MIRAVGSHDDHRVAHSPAVVSLLTYELVAGETAGM